MEDYGLTIKPDTLRKAAVGLVLADSISKNEEAETEKAETNVEAKTEAGAQVGSVEVPKIDSNAFIAKQTLRDLRNEVNSDMR